MPAAPTKYPYLSWKFNKIVLRLPIPKPQQAALGKPMFRVVMSETDMPSAHTASLPILAEWRRQIADAKAGCQDALQGEIARFRKVFEEWDERPLTADEIDLHDRIMDCLYQTQGGLKPAKRRLALAAAQGRVTPLSLPAPSRPIHALITGTVQPSTPFLTHLKDWKERTHLRGKYLDQAVTSVEEFANDVPCDLETLTGGRVQAWIDSKLRPTDGSKPLLPETVRHKLKGCNAFWTWMQANDKADKERNPFAGRTIRDHRTAREKKEAEPVPFAVADVPRLWQQAEADADRDLFAITKIGAYTGMRREKICALQVDQVRTHEGVRYLLEVGDKTISAIRNVPIPSAIDALFDELVADATPDGYLIHDGYKDKNGHRGGEVGKRFSDMKTAMGFKRRTQTFNSLRKTAIKVMKEQREVVLPFYESIVKNIVGHKDENMTSGRYAGVSGLKDKLIVIETISYPD